MRSKYNLRELAVIFAIALLMPDAVFSVLAQAGPAQSKAGDIAATVILSLARGDLTEAQLVDYFDQNKNLLRNNIEQARARYGEEEVSRIVKANLARYQEQKTRIVSNYSAASGQR